jgi:hypothetical protein
MDIFRDLFAVFYSDILQIFFHYAFITAPLWLPVVLTVYFWSVWVDYVRAAFIAKQKYIVLELKLPPEVYKSPAAMELVLAGLHQTGGEGTWYAKYILGKMRPWFSLEIASFEGNVRFFIWTREGFKNLIEAQFYGQYPNIEITEVPDYTNFMPYYDHHRFGLWGSLFKLTKPDPYPIKTYVDFGLDKDPKEEYKIDPLTPVIELMSLMGKGEYMWLQIIFRAHKEKHDHHGGMFDKTTWQDEARKTIKEIYEGMNEEGEDEEGSKSMRRAPTEGEREILKALERSVRKHGFDVGIRGFYFAENDKFNGGRVPAFTNVFKQFGSPSYKGEDEKISFNSFSPTHTTDYDYPWQDFRKIREMGNRHHIVDGYRRRGFFFPPHQEHWFVLNSEELATIFHPIGKTLQTPSVSRVSSRKAEAPTNLPR